MEVYVDVLFLENLIMDFLILAATNYFLKKKMKLVRIFLGALLGAFYVLLIIILPDMELYYTVFSKLFLSLSITVTRFPSSDNLPAKYAPKPPHPTTMI
jgi:stage II sporulation protein GA (sporulation sigma-E factor processing peptidase)